MQTTSETHRKIKLRRKLRNDGSRSKYYRKQKPDSPDHKEQHLEWIQCSRRLKTRYGSEKILSPSDGNQIQPTGNIVASFAYVYESCINSGFLSCQGVVTSCYMSLIPVAKTFEQYHLSLKVSEQCLVNFIYMHSLIVHSK